MFSLVMECCKECAEKEKQLEQQTPVSFQQQQHLPGCAGWRATQPHSPAIYLAGSLAAGWLSS